MLLKKGCQVISNINVGIFVMKKQVATVIFAINLFMASVSAFGATEVTICFSKKDCNDRFSFGSVGDSTPLCSGKCKGQTLPQMYAQGWRLIEVIGNKGSASVFFLERKRKR